MRTHRKFDNPAFILALVTLSLAMLFGGGQGKLGDALAQLLALVLLLQLWRQQPNIKAWPKASLWAILPLFPLLFYLLPWPDSWRIAGQGRSQLVNLLQPVVGTLGVQGSLIPMATERALFWLMPAIALYLAVLQMRIQQKRLLIASMIFWIFVGAVIGLAQKANGADSLLYFYEITNTTSAVGLFANNNHYAIAMAACLPLVWGALVWLFNQRLVRSVHPLWFVLFAGIAILFIVGFMLSGSRAGLALGMLGCLLALPLVIAADQHQGAKHWLLALLSVGLFFSVQMGLYFISLQFDTDPLDDLRLKIFPLVREIAADFAPFGSGPGTFWFAFMQDGGLLANDKIVNHAHNEYLELWMEMRWSLVIVAVPLLLAYTVKSVHVWFRGAAYQPDNLLLARAASIGLLLLIMHSSIDYPLRTSALLTLSGVLAALLARPERAALSASE